MANNRELSQFANVVGYNGGNIGIGTDNPQRKFVVSDNGTEGLEFFPGDGANGSTINAYNRATSSFTPFSLNASDYRISPNGGDEKLRIDSSGRLLCGTSSGSGEPIAAFQGRSNDANDSGIVAITRTGTNPSGSIGELRFATGSDFNKYYGMIICQSDGSTTSTSLPGVLRFSTTASGSTSPTERLRIDSSGDVQARRARSNTAGDVALSIQPSDSTIHYGFRIDSANNNLNLDRVGTGNFVTISADGDIGIGTNDPQKSVHLSAAGSSNVVTTRIQQSTNNTSTDGGALIELGGTRSNGTYGFYGGIKGGRRNSAADNKGYLAFFSDSNDGQSLSEKARIDDGGRLMVQCTSDSSDSLLIVQGNAGDSGTGGQISIQRGGNANPTAPSDLGGLMFKDSAGSRGAVISATCDGDWATDDYPTRLEFKVTNDNAASPTERMRINSAGGVNVGSSKLSAASGDGNIVVDEGVYISAYNGDYQIRGNSAGGGSATLYIGNAAIQASSDRRIKENIVDTVVDAAEELKRVRVVDFTWNDPSDTSFNNRNARGTWTGVIAQELVDVFPFAVNAPRTEEDLSIDQDSEKRWLVDQDQLVPVLIKAFQQSLSRIETLEAQNTDLLARVTALENP